MNKPMTSTEIEAAFLAEIKGIDESMREAVNKAMDFILEHNALTAKMLADNERILKEYERVTAEQMKLRGSQ